VTVEQIDEVTVTVPETLVPVILEPEDAKLRPRTTYEGKFSLQYSTAAMLVHGRVDLTTYTDDVLQDPDVLELAQKVRYEGRGFATYPRAFPGATRVRTTDGRTLEAELAHQPGAPQNPLSDAQVRQKFRDNASLALDADAVASVESAISSLELESDLRAMLARLSPHEIDA
jgi:2-methylcitrate dehydratase PrpD